MKPTIKIFTCLFLFICSFSFGQMKQYNYKRELKGISEQWHKIILPDEIFGETSQDLTDIRIFGITASNDTIEAPCLLRLTTEKISGKEVAFKTLNASYNDKGYYFTFEIPATEPVNQIKLDFKQQNFDWRIKLEGSQNQSEWFTVIENYRVLSIKNDQADFQFTKLNFPNSRYRFFRLCIDSEKKPELTVASVSQYEITNGIFREHPARKIETKNNKQTRQTEIDIELELPVSISCIKIDVLDSFDYYRPVTIKYLADSLQTEQGWKYNYSTLTSGTLNSLEENVFKFNSATVQKLKIFIHNQDNQPLAIGKVQVNGYIHELIARFTEQAIYFLAYGNKGAVKRHYDIDRFTDKIPKILTTLELGEEQTIEKKKPRVSVPLFKNKAWLWTIMTVIILTLGWFSVRMIRKN